MHAITRRTFLAVAAATVVAATVVFAPSANAAASPSFSSPGCDVSLEDRLAWASDRDAELDTASPVDTPTEALRRMYALARLCEGDVVRQSGQTLKGPKAPGVEPRFSFRPGGIVMANVKRKGRAGRVLTCTNTAYDPQFTGSGSVRGGGRSSCNQSAYLAVTTCLGRYFQSSGNTDETACKFGSTTGSAITVYTNYVGCSSVISYRTNFYGVTGNSYTFYFNGGLNGC